ncbi:zinc-dependent metalloprotease [Changchengzhania lutea]|uniref:zinc-dependent metalloprotease n=1 Tax=Changchengzhania lutea TaxID=2049305 RepID=UPI00163D4682|nr:zinc-dependent metalloprotease [Changchengzhania lutea]
MIRLNRLETIKGIGFASIGKLLFPMIILLVTCSLWGQVNNKLDLNDFLASGDFIKVHWQDSKVFFEIDEKLLGKDLLFVRHDKGYKHVIWTKYKDQILLETPRIKSLSGVIIPIDNHPSIEKSILGIFPIIKEKSDLKTLYIDVTDLFLKNSVAWYSNFKETIIPDLSAIEEIKYLKNEIVISTKRVLSKNTSKSTNQVDFSFFLLPESMKPRLFDHRIGYFIEDELSPINHFPKHAKASISRWHLEKKDANKKISVPVKPITFYLDTNIPNKWKPYIKAGILEWLPAFEAAGFKNAIEVKEIPNNIKNWQSNSVNNSVVRWLNKEGIRGQNNKAGSGVSRIVDLRSGEIIKSDIIIGSSYQYFSDSYFIRCSPLDKRAQQYPFSDDLMGALIQSVVAHEAGHAFGIKDANYGEYAYPFDKMRDKKWLQDMGHTPSVMSYARHNYMVQPEDHIPPSLLIRKVGPTDVYTIKWGYESFPNINEPQDELPYLEKMIRRQDSIPWYRYNIGNYEKTGPDCSNEVADNNNPIKSAELGLLNMKRVIELLSTVTKTQKDNELLERLYNKTITLWFDQMSHVMTSIGGYTTHYKSGAQTGAVYTPIPMQLQQEAVDFLNLNAFKIPDWLAHPMFYSRIMYSTSTDKIMAYQLQLLSEILSPLRMKRLENMVFSSKADGVIKALLSKLRIGLWSELSQNKISIIRRRQELQSAYIALLSEAITKPKKYGITNPSDMYFVYSDYSRSIFMSELMLLKKDIISTGTSVTDSITFGHLKRCLLNIDDILIGK